MTHPLDGAFLKLSRAVTRADRAWDMIREYSGTHPYAIQEEMNMDTGGKLWRAVLVGHDPPPRIALIVGESIYNFRCVLDHLVWQLVIANGSIPDDGNAWPICLSVDKWQRWSRTRLKGMTREAKAFVEAEQPCFGVNPYRNKWYAWLDDLCNVDKHRHLYLLGPGTLGGLFNPGIPHGADWFIHKGPVEDGTILASIDREHADVQFGAAVDVVFSKGTLAEGESVGGTLKGFEVLVHQALAFGIKEGWFPPRP
jgi:hypothetical protein